LAEGGGSVGIGTTSPLRALHIYAGNGYAEELWEAGAVSSSSVGRIWRWGTDPSGNFASTALNGNLSNGLVVMSLTSSGNVGIGTAPGAKLDVAGTIRTLSGGLQVWGSGQLQVQFNNQGDPADQHFTELIEQGGQFIGRFVNDAYGSADNWLTVKRNSGSYSVNSVNFPAGNVGIGTSGFLPAARLHLHSDYNNSTTGLMIDASDTSDPERYNLRLFPYVVGAAKVGYMFQTKSATGGTSIPMAFDNAGNVGVRSTTPSAPLSVRVIDQDDLAVYGPFNNCVALQTLLDGQPLSSYGSYGGSENRLILQPLAGNVGIGTTNPTQKLSVAGTIRAYAVVVDTGWSDYVFDKDYRLAPLSEVEAHIKAERHLPGIPSAAEVAEHGVSVGDMQSKLLAKVEELTLHLIAQEKEIAALRQQVTELKSTKP